MLRRRTAAAAHQRQPVLPHERLLRVRESLGTEGEAGAVGAQFGQARVRHAQQRDARVPGEVAQVLGHLGGARGAVQADHVDAQRLQRGQGRADLGAEQHRAGGLEGHGDQQRHSGAGRLHRLAGAQDGRLGLEQVLRGLHEQRVGAPGEQALSVGLVAVADDAVADVPQGGQLGARAHGAQHPARTAVAARELVRRLPGDTGARLGQFVHPAGDLVLARGGVIGAEGVRLDAVDARAEVLGVDRTDDVGAGHVQDLVAALEVLEVLERGVVGLQHRAHRSVGDHDP